MYPLALKSHNIYTSFPLKSIFVSFWDIFYLLEKIPVRRSAHSHRGTYSRETMRQGEAENFLGSTINILEKMLVHMVNMKMSPHMDTW